MVVAVAPWVLLVALGVATGALAALVVGLAVGTVVVVAPVTVGWLASLGTAPWVVQVVMGLTGAVVLVMAVVWACRRP